MATSLMIGGSDPVILKSLETQTPSVARTSPATVNATTGAATSSGSSVSRGLVPQVSGGTVTYNQAIQATAGNSVTVTSSTSNNPSDVVTIYTSPKAVSVSAINQTVSSYNVTNYAGNEYTDSDVANYLPTFTGNVGAGNVNVTGTVYTSGVSSTGLASLTILNVSTTANLGAVGNVRITGGSNGQVLTTNGSGNLSWTTVSGGNSSYGNTDVANYLPTFTGNIGANVVTANLFVGSGANLTNIAGANVGGFVPNANVANTAYAVAAANVSGLGNIATINLDGNVSNLITGTGTFVAIPTVPTVGNIASINLDGNVSNVLRGNGTWGPDANSSYSDSNVVTLLSAFGSNTIVTTGNVQVGNIIGNGQALTGIAGANVTGNVGNANLSQYLNVSDVNNNFSYHVVLSAGSGDKSLHIDADDNLQYNPSDGTLTATRVDATYVLANLNFANGYLASNLVGSTSNIVNGNSNISITTANGNITLSAVGTSNVLVITGTGANVTGTANVSGNLSTGGNLSVTGNTSVTGTLSSTGKIGYSSGSTVTQTTNRGNGVTINTLAGTIITTSVAMVANEIDTFSVINSSVDPNNDIVLAQIVSPNQGTYNCIAGPAIIGGFSNGFYINIVNISGFTTSDEALTIRFMVIKAPNA